MKKGIVYIFIYNKIKQESQMGVIGLKRMKYILGKIYHVPKEYRLKVIREIEDMRLIKRVDAYNYRVNGTSNGILA